jgi:hypothetical protein
MVTRVPFACPGKEPLLLLAAEPIQTEVSGIVERPLGHPEGMAPILRDRDLAP